MKKKLHLLLLSMVILGLFFACSQNQTESSSKETESRIDSQSETRGIPVEALVIKAKRITENIPLTGVLKPFHEVDLVAEVSGKIEKITKELGDRVSTRDTLAYIDDDIPQNNYRQAQSQLISAESNLKIAELNLNSDKELYENGDISKLAFQNSQLSLKTAQANHMSALATLSTMEKTYQDTRITTPIRGLVSRKYIDLGTMVSPNMPLYRVVDISTMKIIVGIPQTYISRLKEGSKAQISVAALNNVTFEGKVKYISPQADESTGTFSTEIHVRNTPDLKLRAGMSVSVSLLLTDEGNYLSVPDYALVTRDGSNYVYKIKSQKAQLENINIAETFGSQVIISEGLTEGDTIVVVGMKNLGVDTKVWIEAVY
jgi:HlyD family secretion protein